MSKAAKTRLILHLIALGTAALAWWILMPASGWLAVLAAIALFFGIGALAETMFRRLATDAERREDLEDRVRNSPS
jgi:hypothetical protein